MSDSNSTTRSIRDLLTNLNEVGHILRGIFRGSGNEKYALSCELTTFFIVFDSVLLLKRTEQLSTSSAQLPRVRPIGSTVVVASGVELRYIYTATAVAALSIFRTFICCLTRSGGRHQPAAAKLLLYTYTQLRRKS